MKKQLVTSILCVAAITALGQSKKSSGSTVTKEDAKKFYHTPYKTRNSGSFGKSFRVLSLGYGFPTILDPKEVTNLNYGFGYQKHTGIGPLMVGYEFAIRDEVGLVPLIQYGAKKWTGYYEDDYGNYIAGDLKASGICVGLLGKYHLNKWIPLKKLDVFVGTGIGVFFDTWKTEIENQSISNFNDTQTHVRLLAIVGAKYYFNKSFSVFAEGGTTGMSNFNIGIAFRTN